MEKALKSLYDINIEVPFYEFSKWVVNEAVKDNVDSLYFLSRDGYLFKKIIDNYLLNIDSCGIEIKYIYVSRITLLKTLMYGKGIDEIYVEFKKLGFYNWYKLKKIMNFEIKDIEYIENMYKKLHLENEIEFLDILMNSEKISKMILNSIELHYYSMKEYFKNCGLLDNSKKISIVDSGWLGNTQVMMQNVIHIYGSKSIISGYYFGLYNYKKSYKKNYKTFYFSKNNAFIRKSMFNSEIFEYISSENIGSIHTFVIDKNCIIPIFDNHKYDEKKKKVQELILKKCRCKSNTSIQYVLNKLMFFPTKDIADYIGDVKFKDDFINNNERKLAPKFEDSLILRESIFKRIFKIIFLKIYNPKEVYWIYGSIVRNFKNDKIILIYLYYNLFFCIIKNILKSIKFTLN